jgi:hypothetical protein
LAVEWQYLNPGDGAVVDVTFGNVSEVGSPVEFEVIIVGDIIGGGSPTRKDTAPAMAVFYLATFLLSWAIILAGVHSENPVAQWVLFSTGGIIYPLSALWYGRRRMRTQVPEGIARAIAGVPGTP